MKSIAYIKAFKTDKSLTRILHGHLVRCPDRDITSYYL